MDLLYYLPNMNQKKAEEQVRVARWCCDIEGENKDRLFKKQERSG